MTKSELLIAQFQRHANAVDVISALHTQEIISGYTNSELNCIECIGHMRRPNASRISAEMGMTRSAISKILKKLQSKGAADSYQLPENQKEIYYRLTPYGKEIFKKHRLRHQEWEHRDLDFFNTLDAATLDAALLFMNAYNGYLELKVAEYTSGDAAPDSPDGGA